MPTIEKQDMAVHREQLSSDVTELVETYRSMFDLDGSEIDRHLSDRLILAEVRDALDDVERTLVGPDRR